MANTIDLKVVPNSLQISRNTGDAKNIIPVRAYDFNLFVDLVDSVIPSTGTIDLSGDVTVGRNLVVTGTSTFNGAIILGDAAADSLTVKAAATYEDIIAYSNQTGITAFATGGQASATALTEEINNVTVCATAGDSVKLPAAVAGKHVYIKNSGVAALDVFPASADSIDALAINLAVRVQPGSAVNFYAKDAVVWESDKDVSLTLFAPTTASGGLELKAANSAGNTITTIVNASQAAARTYTILDAGASANFVMSEGAATINGAKTLSSQLAISATTNQLRLGDIAANDVIINSVAPAADSIVTIPDLGTAWSVVGTTGAQSITGVKTLTSPVLITAPTAAGATWPNLGTVTTADINGGTLDGTVIGEASAAAGTFTTVAASTSATVTSASASSLAVGLTGATNPAFSVDSSAALQVQGVKITGAALGTAVSLSTISSGADASLNINPKGTGIINADGVRLKAGKVGIQDSDLSHRLDITTSSNLSADRELILVPGDSSRTVTISGNATISQDYSATGSPGFTNIDLGSSGVAGSVDVFPTTAARGKIAVLAADSVGDTTTTITNASQAAARIYTIPDGGASANFLLSEGNATINGTKTFGSAIALPQAFATVDGISVSALVYTTVTVTAALLDGAGTVAVFTAGSGDQIKVDEIKLIGGGTNFGAGGDRTIALTDGTTTYVTIANADIEAAPATTLRWGDAKVPFATGTADTATVAGQNLRFAYAGGTTDHAGVGSIKFRVGFTKIA